MRLFEHREVYRGEGYEIRVVGAPRFDLRDLYHLLMRLPGWATVAFIVAAYLALNVLFAAAYLATGGVANAAPGSFPDAFFFSVQTMGTIGYGAMYPVTRAANALAVAESVAGLLATALSTGLVYARFSQLRARVAFSSRLAVGPLDAGPALVIRVGNERRGRLVDVRFRLTLLESVRTADGGTLYKNLDVALLRSRATSLSRAWLVVHPLGPGSPLLGETAESLTAKEAELTLEVSGSDETSGQPVHAQRTWVAASIAWGARFADVLSETADGNLELDLRRFHDLVPAPLPPEGAGAGGPSS